MFSLLLLVNALAQSPVPAPSPAASPIESSSGASMLIGLNAPKSSKSVVAFPTVRLMGKVDATLAAVAKTLDTVVLSDLEYMDLFRFLPQNAFTEDVTKSGISPGEFQMSDWTAVGAEILLKTRVQSFEKNVIIEAFLYDTSRGATLMSKRYQTTERDSKIAAHTLASDVLTALTGLPGIFLTKIAMSCDRTGKKEIYVMNIDGTEVRQITHHHSLSIAPAWSPDGGRIAYSLYNRHRGNKKNIDLYEFDFATSSTRLLSNRLGINSGAAYAPDGVRLALTMSFLGNPEIFLLEPKRGTVTRLTHSGGFDVDPVWSPNGKSIAFVSSRSGQPMVYSMNADGGGVKRLTFAGRYNATPSWSPRGDRIAFAGWLEHQFDVFIMNADGTNIQRLTKNQGNNEDPMFSPDGNFIVFSSNRTGGKNVYVMNTDGSYVRRLTYGLGNCVAPRWSNSPIAK